MTKQEQTIQKKHLIYKTTNIKNGKFYIGKHTVLEKYDYLYLGSGLALSYAIKKYGRQNFIREILFEFDDIDECLIKEQEIINEELIKDPMCYNIATGGNGGKIQSSQSRKKIQEAVTKEWSNNNIRKQKARKSAIKRNTQGNFGVGSYTNNSRQKISKQASNRWKNDEYKIKVSKAISIGLTGKKQSVEHIEEKIKAQNKTKYCLHCNSYYKIAAYGRWHGDKCKEKK